MFKSIMVTLDGTPLSEKVLPLALTLTHQLDAELTLMQATQIRISSLESNEDELQNKHFAKNYLNEIRGVITESHTPNHLEPHQVRISVGYGDTVERIAALADYKRADLVMMATHARSGVDRLITGSVATHALSEVVAPLLLYRPNQPDAHQDLSTILTEVISPIKNLVVTLDGSLEAEKSLKPAFELARQIDATLYLLRVEPLPKASRHRENYEPFYQLSLSDSRREELCDYLEKWQDKALDANLRCTRAVRAGEAAQQIIKFVTELQRGNVLVLMTSKLHGRIGPAVVGSVVEEVLRESHLPVLVTYVGS